MFLHNFVLFHIHFIFRFKLIFFLYTRPFIVPLIIIHSSSILLLSCSCILFFYRFLVYFFLLFPVATLKYFNPYSFILNLVITKLWSESNDDILSLIILLLVSPFLTILFPADPHSLFSIYLVPLPLLSLFFL